MRPREQQSYFGPAGPEQRVRAVPGQGLNVPLYLLGSSTFSATLAADMELPFAFASHFAPEMLHQALDLYRTQFRPSAQLPKPHVMVGVNIFAADTDEEASRLFTSDLRLFGSMHKSRNFCLQHLQTTTNPRSYATLMQSPFHIPGSDLYRPC